MPDPRASLHALRALSALFLYKILYPALFMIVIVMVALYVLTVLLTLTFSSWWLLLLVILIPLTIVFLVTGFILWFLLQKLLPRRLSKHERQQINRFTDKLFTIAERARLPYPVLLFLVGKDVIRGKESRFLSELIGDSRGLMKEFEEIQGLFRD